MRYSVLDGDQVVGESDLEEHDEGMGLRRGRFEAGPGYSAVQSVFRLFSNASDLPPGDPAHQAYYRERDALKLSVVDTATGDRVPGIVHIIDFEDIEHDLQIELYPPY